MSVRAFFRVFFWKKNQDLGGAKGDFANKAKRANDDSGYIRDSPRAAQKCIYCLPPRIAGNRINPVSFDQG